MKKEPFFRGDQLRPPAPDPAPDALSLPKLLHAVLFNPLAIWSRQHFVDPMVVSKTPLGVRVVVSDPAAIKRMLVDNAANYGRDDLQRRILLRTTGRSLFTAEGEQWRQQRKALAPFFSPKALESYPPKMSAAAEDAVERMATSGGEIDLGREMAVATIDVLSRTIFGGKLDEPPGDIASSVRLFAEANGQVAIGDLLGLPVWWPRLHQIFGLRTIRAVRRRASRIVARSRSAGGDPGLDVVAALLTVRTEAGDALGAREIKDNVSTLLGAGSDTVVVALTWAIFLLSQAPATRAIVEAEIDAVWDGDLTTSATLDKLVWTRAVIEEAMRLYPPAPLIGRVALADDVLCGRKFPRGTVVMIAPWVVHRHHGLWRDPDCFDPERFLPGRRETIPRFAYLPFGAGPRICLGMGFAMQEAVMLLATFLKHLRFERADNEQVQLRLCITLQPKTPLRMRVFSRDPGSGAAS